MSSFKFKNNNYVPLTAAQEDELSRLYEILDAQKDEIEHLNGLLDGMLVQGPSAGWYSYFVFNLNVGIIK